MKTTVYHIGILKHNVTIIVQAVRNIDSLDSEIAMYCGQRITTKKRLVAIKMELFNEITNKPYFANCTKIVVR